jgi:hypothetical protein
MHPYSTACIVPSSTIVHPFGSYITYIITYCTYMFTHLSHLYTTLLYRTIVSKPLLYNTYIQNNCLVMLLTVLLPSPWNLPYINNPLISHDLPFVCTLFSSLTNYATWRPKFCFYLSISATETSTISGVPNNPAVVQTLQISPYATSSDVPFLFHPRLTLYFFPSFLFIYSIVMTLSSFFFFILSIMCIYVQYTNILILFSCHTFSAIFSYLFPLLFSIHSFSVKPLFLLLPFTVFILFLFLSFPKPFSLFLLSFRILSCYFSGHPIPVCHA